MKYTITILIALFITCFVAPHDGVAQSTDYTYFQGSGIPDTITDAGDLTYTDSRRYRDRGTLECHFSLNKLSGTAAGTIYVQTAYTPAGADWYNKSSITIPDNASTDTLITIDDLNAVRYRIHIDGTGTQSTEVDVCDCVWKKK